MKKLDYLLVNETVLVSSALNGKDVAEYIGQVISVTPNGGDVLVEFPDQSSRSYPRNELLHLYPKRMIMQGLVSNLDMADKNFKTILKVFKLLSERKAREALLLAATNELTKLYCLTDCANWLELHQNFGRSHKRLSR